MELAGLSCAHAIAKEFKTDDESQTKDILVVAGPGNNGLTRSQLMINLLLIV
jgi:NAD(P)H-hydrate repair Nnr-like enzyme with NAD(P)H-hydrate epimerase domain